MSEPLTVALVGAGGAVLGSGISTLSVVWLERRRAKREERAERLARRGALREAGRLVAEELRETEQLIEQAARRGRYSPGLRGLPSDTWARYKAVLATNLIGPADWASIAVAYEAINRVNWAVIERRGRMVSVGSRTEGEPVEPEDGLRSAWERARHARWVLDSEVGISASVEIHVRESADRAQALWPDGLEAAP